MEMMLTAIGAEPPAVHVNAATTATQRGLPSPLPLAVRPVKGLSPDLGDRADPGGVAVHLLASEIALNP